MLFCVLAVTTLSLVPRATLQPLHGHPQAAPPVLSIAKRGALPMLSVTSSAKLFLDEAEMIEATAFPIAPEELIYKTKSWIVNQNGIDDPDSLADDFEFVGPVVGPLSKDAYLEAVGGFDITEAFPDLSPRLYGFRTDPLEPGRVWYISRATGTFSGPFAGGAIKPTGKSFEMPPESISVVWNADGKVERFTVGVCMDRGRGDSGGLGGLFGIMYAVGRPFPFREANPWKKSFRFKLFDLVGSLTQRASRKQAAAQAEQ